MKSIWILGIVLTSLYSNCYSEEENATAPSNEIAGIGVGVDLDGRGNYYYTDDGYYYYYNERPTIWIGPGYYYGVYYDDQYAYYRGYGSRYGRYYGNYGYRRHHRHHRHR